MRLLQPLSWVYRALALADRALHDVERVDVGGALPQSADLRIARVETVEYVRQHGARLAEPLAKQGAAERVQIYGEIGLKYGNEKAHGLVKAVRG